jgi:Trp operon repressor
MAAQNPPPNYADIAIKIAAAGDRTCMLPFVLFTNGRERMNVLKPSPQTTIKILLSKEISQREIERKTGIDRKTIRRCARLSGSSPTGDSAISKSPTSAAKLPFRCRARRETAAVDPDQHGYPVRRALGRGPDVQVEAVLAWGRQFRVALASPQPLDARGSELVGHPHSLPLRRSLAMFSGP